MNSFTSQLLVSTVGLGTLGIITSQYAHGALPTTNAFHIYLLATASSAAVLAFYKLFFYPLFLDPLRHLPGPRGGLPILGRDYEHIRRPMSKQVYRWMTETPNEGLIRHKGLGARYCHIPTTPSVLSDLLVKKSYDFEKPPEGRSILRTLLGDGLVVSEGEIHKFQRKNLNPSFSFRHIKDLYSVMWATSLEMTQAIKTELAVRGEKESGAEFELKEWANRATLDIIGVAALGRSFGALQNGDDELIPLYHYFFLEVDWQKKLWFLLRFLVPVHILNYTGWRTHLELMACAKRIREVCAVLISQKRSNMEKEAVPSVDTFALLIRSNNFSDGELVDQLLTVLAAGHETTSSAFTWVLYILARNPSFQKRLRDELQQHARLDTNSGAAEIASVLEPLPYLNAICSETLRLYPTVPNTRRVAIRDTQVGHFRIPAKTHFIVPIWWINRMPDFWGSDAGEFKPERWIDVEKDTTGDGKKLKERPNASGGALSNFSLMTFNHGPRSCIGQGFAKAELRCLVAAWVLNFEFSMAREGEIVVEEGGVTVKPKGGLDLRIKSIHP